MPLSDLLQLPGVVFVPQTRRAFDEGVPAGVVPLMSALALTVHRAQGLTLHVMLDFCSGPAGGKLASRYAALSRVTRLDGIRLLGKPTAPDFACAHCEHDATAEAANTGAVAAVQQEGEDDDRQYDFDHIVSHTDARNKAGELERMYTVRFIGYGPEEDLPFWASDLRVTASDAVDAYERSLKKRQRKPARRQKVRDDEDDEEFTLRRGGPSKARRTHQ